MAEKNNKLKFQRHDQISLVFKDLSAINAQVSQDTTGTIQLKTEDLRTSKKVL